MAPRSQVTLRTATWIMRRMICDKMSVKAVAASVGLGWNKAGLDAHDEHLAVSMTYTIYQELIDAYDQDNRRDGKIAMYKLLKRIHTGLPAGLAELAQLGRSLWARRAEILACFDTGASNGPVEAINGRLEHLRGIALGFRNLNHYILVRHEARYFRSEVRDHRFRVVAAA